MSSYQWLAVTTIAFGLAHYALWKIPALRPKSEARRLILCLGLIPAFVLEGKIVNEFLSMASFFGLMFGLLAGRFLCRADERVEAGRAAERAAREREMEAAAVTKQAEEAEQKRRQDEAEAAKQREEIQAEKARLREERERIAAVQSLHAHLGVITGAVRAIRADADNTVLITTIDEELKSIGRNPKITQEMVIAPDVREEVELIVKALAQRGVDDQILLNRLHKIFRIGGIAFETGVVSLKISQ